MEKLCEEKHKRIDEKLELNERRLNNHGERIDKLEQDNMTFKTEIKNLCDNIKSLTTTMRWFMGLLIGAFVSFFFYAIQHNIF